MFVATRSLTGAMTPTFPCILLPPWPRCFHGRLDYRRRVLVGARRDGSRLHLLQHSHAGDRAAPPSAPISMASLSKPSDLSGWRAIERIDLAQIAERAMTVHELQIVLNAPLGSALVADWRKQPIYRLLMRLPWCMDHSGVVRVKLEPFRPAGR